MNPRFTNGFVESKGVPRVGLLWHAGSAEEEAPYLGLFEQGLKDLGYFDGARPHRLKREALVTSSMRMTRHVLR